MFIIDPFALLKIVLSISLISFMVSTFTTSYNAMSKVEEKLKRRTEIAQSGIPYKQSEAYKKLYDIDLINILQHITKWSRRIVILLVICLVSTLFKPVSAEKNAIILPSFEVINTSKMAETKDTEQVKESQEKSKIELIDIQSDSDTASIIPILTEDQVPKSIKDNEENTDISLHVQIYVYLITILSIIASIALCFLAFNMVKIQQIQIWLLQLEKDYSFR